MKYTWAFLCLFIQLQLASNFIYSRALAAIDQTTASDNSYLDAERYFLRDDLESSLKEINVFFTKYKNDSSPQTLSRAYNLRGLIYFQMKNNSMAITNFEKAVDIAEQNFAATDSSLHLARYNLANALFHDEQDDKANRILTKIEPRALDIDTRIRYYNLLGNTLLKLEKYSSAIIAFLLTANELEREDSVATEALVRKAYSLSKKIFSYSVKEDLERLKTYESKMSSDGIGSWTLRLIIARGLSILGNRDQAGEIVQDFIQSVPTHPLQSEANEIYNLFQKIAVVEPNKIGVLLPLSGNFSKYGDLSLNSIMMALSAYQDLPVNPKSPQNKISLVIRDSGETIESALKAFDQLAAEDHVVAVVGPLLSRQASAVAQKAQEYGVPLFSLSQKQGLEHIGSYVFPIALTPSQQIQILIHFCIKERGFRRFAILAPDNPAGDEFVRLFWDSVEKNDGIIAGIERYDTGTTDFRNETKKLLGLHYLDARRLESEELKRKEDAYASKLKVRGVLRKRLLQNFRPRPIVDFDALFVPDGPQAIGQIAPSFAIYDVKQIPFLGINTWNTPEIIRRAGQYLQNSYFVDTFYPNSRNKNSAAFVSEYNKNFNVVPGTLEVQAYDATKIIIAALDSGSVFTRSDLINNILTKKNHSGISGSFFFGPDGFERSAYLLGVKGSEIMEIMPPTLVK